jgi:L-fuculose-phosphate aldolase
MYEEELFGEEEIKREIIRVIKVLYERGMITALGGNVSARMPGENEFWITPSQVFKGALRVEDLVKVDLEGNLIQGYLKPSIETPMHATVYKIRPEVNAVVHAHNPYTLGLALAGVSIPPITDEAVILLRKVEVVPFALPGTDKLANYVGEVLKRGAKAIILQNHGVLGVGYNLLEAEAIVELIEAISKMIFICYTLGKKPPLIPEEDIELFKKLYKI